MSAQHTPGPWFPTKVSDYNEVARIGGAWNISTMRPLADFGDVDADARLIAAAPDLLECLVYALEMLEVDRVTLRECHTGPDGRIDPHDAEMCDELDAVASRFRAAIAKATSQA